MIGAAADYLLTWTEGAVGQTHLVFALLALTSGGLVAVLRKGTRAHGRIGITYLLSMVALNASALMKYDLTGGPNMFHGFAVASLATITAGYVAVLILKRGGSAEAGRAHATFMIWSYFGLVMALVAEIVTRSFPFLLHGEGGWTRFTVALTGATALGAVLTHALLGRALTRTFGPRRRASAQAAAPR